MNSADIVLLDETLSRLHRLFGRRAPTEAEIRFWFEELVDYPTADVIDVLRAWELHAEDEHPPTLRFVARACRMKRSRHETARQARVIIGTVRGAQPMAQAFAKLWADTRGDVTSWPAWRAAVERDPQTPAYLQEFVAALPPWDPPKPMPRGTPALRPIGAQVARVLDADAEREAREERLGIQMPGA